MRKLIIIIGRRWPITLLSGIALFLLINGTMGENASLFKSTVTIAFIGQEGEYSPEVEAKRFMEESFLGKVKLFTGVDSSVLRNKTDISFPKVDQMVLGYVSEDLAGAKQVIRVMSEIFVEERDAVLDQQFLEKSDVLKKLMDGEKQSETRLKEQLAL